MLSLSRSSVCHLATRLWSCALSSCAVLVLRMQEESPLLGAPLFCHFGLSTQGARALRTACLQWVWRLDRSMLMIVGFGLIQPFVSADEAECRWQRLSQVGGATPTALVEPRAVARVAGKRRSRSGEDCRVVQGLGEVCAIIARAWCGGRSGRLFARSGGWAARQIGQPAGWRSLGSASDCPAAEAAHPHLAHLCRRPPRMLRARLILRICIRSREDHLL